MEASPHEMIRATLEFKFRGVLLTPTPAEAASLTSVSQLILTQEGMLAICSRGAYSRILVIGKGSTKSEGSQGTDGERQVLIDRRTGEATGSMHGP